MTDLQEASLRELRERIARLDGPDREVDAAISATFGDKTDWHVVEETNKLDWRPGDYTASIDSALGLVERVLPGWAVMLSRIENVPSRAPLKDCEAQLWLPAVNTQRLKREMFRTDAVTLSLAILLALLDALIAQHTEATEQFDWREDMRNIYADVAKRRSVALVYVSSETLNAMHDAAGDGLEAPEGETYHRLYRNDFISLAELAGVLDE